MVHHLLVCSGFCLRIFGLSFWVIQFCELKCPCTSFYCQIASLLLHFIFHRQDIGQDDSSPCPPQLPSISHAGYQCRFCLNRHLGLTSVLWMILPAGDLIAEFMENRPPLIYGKHFKHVELSKKKNARVFTQEAFQTLWEGRST